jgi:hypothetical protein
VTAASTRTESRADEDLADADLASGAASAEDRRDGGEDSEGGGEHDD